MDWSIITARLATGGGVITEKDVETLVDSGFQVIVDCRQEFDDAPLLASHPTIRYLWAPTADDGQPKPAFYWAKILEFVLPLLAQPGFRAYLHCSAGVNRGPSAAYAVLRALGLSPTMAESLIRTARPGVGLRYKNDVDQAIKALNYD